MKMRMKKRTKLKMLMMMVSSEIMYYPLTINLLKVLTAYQPSLLRPMFPSTARVSSVSKLFIIWHSVSDSKMHFWCNQSV